MNQDDSIFSATDSVLRRSNFGCDRPSMQRSISSLSKVLRMSVQYSILERKRYLIFEKKKKPKTNFFQGNAGCETHLFRHESTLIVNSGFKPMLTTDHL